MTPPRFDRLVLAAVLTLALAGCTADGSPATTAASDATTTTTAAPSGPSSTTTGVPECLAGDIGFGTTGLVGTPGEDTGDAARLSGVTWDAFDGCERLELEFVTGDGAPASVMGEASAELRDAAGIVRVRLPDLVTASSLADGIVDGDLVQRFFVVRDGDGGMYVDLHLTPGARESGVAVRVFDVDAPARAIIDVQPGGIPATTPPAVTDTLVVLLPTPGPVVLPFLVRGYARDLSAGAVARLIADGTEVTSAQVEGTGEDDAWRAFETVIDAGTPGPAQLEVSARAEAVLIDITIDR